MTNKQNVPEATYMLYKYPGDKFLHGDYFSTKIVKESELPEALDEEWFLTSKEAKESNPPKEDATEAEIDQNDDENKSNEAVSEATESELPEAADEESVPDKGHTKKRGGRKRNADK